MGYNHKQDLRQQNDRFPRTAAAVCRHHRGFTITELLIVIAIIAILAVPAAFLLVHFVRNSVFLPNQLNMDMLAADAMDIMIEGDSTARGLRYSRAFSTIQPYQVTFVNQDAQTVSYRLDTGTSKLYRSVNGGAEALIPYYATTGINLAGKSGKVFSYYDGNEAVTAVAANVRWVTMTLIAQTGTGAFSSWEGLSEQYSAVAVYRFQ